MAKARNIAEINSFGPMKNRIGVKLGLASTGFLNLYAKGLNAIGLTPSRVLALACIHSSPGIDQKSFSTNLAINEASAMSVINRLELGGLVERRPGRDKRTNALFLTNSGYVSFRQALDIEDGLSERIFGHLDDGELGLLLSSINGILEKLDS